MSLKFGRIQPWTAELAALDKLKKSYIREYSKYFDDLLSGERLLPFGLLVLYFDHVYIKLAYHKNMAISKGFFIPNKKFSVSLPPLVLKSK